MVTVATVQRETTDSKQNLNLATCQSETSSDASQNSKGCTVPPPSVFLLLWKAVLCLQCLFYLWTFCWCSSPVLFYSLFLLLGGILEEIVSLFCLLLLCLCCTSVPEVLLCVTQSFCLDWNWRSCSKKGVGCSCTVLGIGKRRSYDSKQLQVNSGKASCNSWQHLVRHLTKLLLSPIMCWVKCGWKEVLAGSGWDCTPGSWVRVRLLQSSSLGPQILHCGWKRRSQVPPWGTPGLRRRSSWPVPYSAA